MPHIVRLQTGVDHSLDSALEKMGFVILGRQPLPDVFPDPWISRFHATLLREERQYFLVDHSLGGTCYRATASAHDSTVLHSVLLHLGREGSGSDLPHAPGERAATYQFDRTTQTTYMQSLARFLKLLDDPDQRKNLLSWGIKLTDGMVVELASPQSAYRFDLQAFTCGPASVTIPPAPVDT